MSACQANLYHAMVRTGLTRTGGHLPSMSIPSPTPPTRPTSDQADPVPGRPSGMAIGLGGAEWKVSGSAPLREVLKAGKVTHRAISDHGKGER